MSVDEESRFLDVLAKHFPAESQARDQCQPSETLKDEDDEFSAFDAIMSDGGSLPARARNETPRKPMAGNGYGRSPPGVAEFGQYY